MGSLPCFQNSNQQKNEKKKHEIKLQPKIHPSSKISSIHSQRPLTQGNTKERSNSISSHTTYYENLGETIKPNEQQEPNLQSIREEESSRSYKPSQFHSSHSSGKSASQSKKYENNQVTFSDNKINEEEEFEDDNLQPFEYIIGDLIEPNTKVYSALNIYNGQLLAVKIIPILGEERIDQVIDRVERILKLEHKNIHSILGFNQTDGQQCKKLNIVMPYESGGSIKWLLQKFNKFSPNLAIIFMKQILEGLDYLEKQDLCHRNLKTSNVLVGEEANAKLSDIRILTSFELSIYSAPECFEKGEYSIFADVWSAGCIFMEMLTQINPWYIDQENVTIDYIREALKQKRRENSLNIKIDFQILTRGKTYAFIVTRIRLLQKQFNQFDFDWKDFTPEDQLQASLAFSQHQQQKKSKIMMKKQPSQHRVFEGEGTIFKSGSLSQISSLGESVSKKSPIQNQQNHVKLTKLFNKMTSSEFPCFLSGGEAADGSLISFSYLDLQQVLNKKAQCVFQDILEEEEITDDKIQDLNKRQIQNPLLALGVVRSIPNLEESIVPSDIQQAKDQSIINQLIGKNNKNDQLIIEQLIGKDKLQANLNEKKKHIQNYDKLKQENKSSQFLNVEKQNFQKKTQENCEQVTAVPISKPNNLKEANQIQLNSLNERTKDQKNISNQQIINSEEMITEQFQPQTIKNIHQFSPINNNMKTIDLLEEMMANQFYNNQQNVSSSKALDEKSILQNQSNKSDEQKQLVEIKQILTSQQVIPNKFYQNEFKLKTEMLNNIGGSQQNDEPQIYKGTLNKEEKLCQLESMLEKQFYSNVDSISNTKIKNFPRIRGSDEIKTPYFKQFEEYSKIDDSDDSSHDQQQINQDEIISEDNNEDGKLKTDILDILHMDGQITDRGQKKKEYMFIKFDSKQSFGTVYYLKISQIEYIRPENSENSENNIFLQDLDQIQQDQS